MKILIESASDYSKLQLEYDSKRNEDVAEAERWARLFADEVSLGLVQTELTDKEQDESPAPTSLSEAFRTVDERMRRAFS